METNFFYTQQVSTYLQSHLMVNDDSAEDVIVLRTPQEATYFNIYNKFKSFKNRLNNTSKLNPPKLKKIETKVKLSAKKSEYFG